MKIESFEGDYRWLSNFWPCQVEFEGIKYPSTENAYQAAKILNPQQRLEFCNITPGKAKKMGRFLKCRTDWNEVKLGIMEDLNRQKYSQPEFRAKLLATGDAEIIEGNTWGDTFWGVCKDVGQNHLGKIIMAIREQLK